MLGKHVRSWIDMNLRDRVLCLSLLAPLAAQNGAAAQPAPDPVAMVGRAEKLCGSGAKEDGVLLCWQALDAIAALPGHPVRDAAALTARFLLVTHDAQYAEREKVWAQVAKLQLELAQAYRGKKWFEVAETRLLVAESYDREAAAKERALLQTQRAKAKPVEMAPPVVVKPAGNPLLRRDNTTLVTGTWRDTEDLLESAAHPGGEHMFSWITRATHEDHEIGVEFRAVAANQEHNAGIWFGGDGRSGAGTGHIARCTYYPKERSFMVELYAVREWKYEIMAEALQPAAPLVDGFHRLGVQVNGDRLRVQMDGQPPIEAKAAGVARGDVGLVVGLRSPTSCAVQFRGLLVGPLPSDAPSDDELRAAAQSKAQNDIVAAVDRAKALLEKKQPEPASFVLRDARAEIDKLTPGLLRDNLASSIDAMIAAADPLAGRRRKAAADCSAALVALADRYAAAGTPRLAQWIVRHAARFDPDGMVARLAAAQKAVDDWNAAQAIARAAELAPPTDDGAVLREWFAEGRLLDSRLRPWTVEGAVARVDDLQPGDGSTWLPKNGMPPLKKVSVHVRLPIATTSAGWCFDVAGPHEYAIAMLARQATGLQFVAWRYTNGGWLKLAGKTVPFDPWRLDGWFQIELEATATGITARSCGAELVIDRKKLGAATGRIGLWADNQGKVPATIELRAFRIVP